MAMETMTAAEYLAALGGAPPLKLPAGKHRPRHTPGEMNKTEEISITIPGTPMGKPRMTRRDKWAKRECVVRFYEWANEARRVAGPMPSPETIQRLDWTAYFEPPESWSKKKRAMALGTLHRSKPDRDNIDKAILDLLFKSDSAIASGTIEKRWGEPARVEIRITVG